MNLTRRAAFALLTLAAVPAALPALAADKMPYSEAAFDAANKAGKPILVEIHAPWCPTCKAQAPIIGQVTADARFKPLAIFTVDFDSQKDALKKFNAKSQSTLITFKGGKEAARSAGDTDAGSIKKLIETTL
jgi:thioredoxin 1